MCVSHSFCSYMHAFPGNLNAIFLIFILSLSAILLLFNDHLLPLPPFTLASLKTRSHNFPERNEGRKPFYILLLPTVLCAVHSHFWLFITCQSPLSMGFSRQEYWSVLPFPPPGELPDPETKPVSTHVSCIAGGFFFFLPLSHLGSPFFPRNSSYWSQPAHN